MHPWYKLCVEIDQTYRFIDCPSKHEESDNSHRGRALPTFSDRQASRSPAYETDCADLVPAVYHHRPEPVHDSCDTCSDWSRTRTLIHPWLAICNAPNARESNRIWSSYALGMMIWLSNFRRAFSPTAVILLYSIPPSSLEAVTLLQWNRGRRFDISIILSSVSPDD